MAIECIGCGCYISTDDASYSVITSRCCSGGCVADCLDRLKDIEALMGLSPPEQLSVKEAQRRYLKVKDGDSIVDSNEEWVDICESLDAGAARVCRQFFEIQESLVAERDTADKAEARVKELELHPDEGECFDMVMSMADDMHTIRTHLEARTLGSILSGETPAPKTAQLSALDSIRGSVIEVTNKLHSAVKRIAELEGVPTS